MTLFIITCLIIFIVAIGFLYQHFHRNGKNSDKLFGMAFAVTLPVLTLVGYLTIGNPQALRSTASDQASSSLTDAEQSLSPEQIQKAITALETETRDNPSDINKLVMLANSYAISQRFNDSASTWDKIVKLDGSAETLLRAADAHTFANKGAVDTVAQDLIDRALQLVPQHPQGLWMAGMSAVQKGNLEKGKELWQRLYPLLAHQPDQQQELATLINELDSELASPPQTEQPIKNALTGASITINVSLDPEVATQTKATDTVFIFARATQGPPAPLAVKQLQVSDLPATIELTEKDAMIPQMTISTFPNITISAKVSKSGNPSNRDGDINSQAIELNGLDNIDEQSLIIGQ